MEALLKKSGWSERLDYGGCIPIDQYEDKEKRKCRLSVAVIE